MMLPSFLLALALQAQAVPPTGAAEPAPPPPRMDFRSAAGAGAAALAGKDYDAAIAAYEAALADRPDSAEAAYNLGVALYHAGRFKDAEKRFAQAGASASNGPRNDAGLAASSLFNRAASFYGATRPQAEAAQRMVEAGTQGDAAAEPIDPAALDQAIKDAKESFKGFKDAAYAAPEDAGARANAEQSMRLVRALEELRKQQQQQQQQQQDKQQQQDQEKQQDQKDKQDQPQQNDQKNQEQSDQSQQSTGDQKQPQDQQKQDQSKQEQSKPDQSKPDQQEPPKDEPKPEAGDRKEQPKEGSGDGQPPPKDGEMTKEQADRLLQAVRDRERERRTAQERKADAARGRPPAKDW